MTHRMIFNQTGYFGRGAIAHIAPEITRRGLSKAFIVTDPVLADNGTATRITDLLDQAGIGWEIFSDAPQPADREGPGRPGRLPHLGRRRAHRSGWRLAPGHVQGDLGHRHQPPTSRTC